MRARVVAFGYRDAGVVAAGGREAGLLATAEAGFGVDAGATAEGGGGGGAVATFFFAQAAVNSETTARAIRVRLRAWFMEILSVTIEPVVRSEWNPVWTGSFCRCPWTTL